MGLAIAARGELVIQLVRHRGVAVRVEGLRGVWGPRRESSSADLGKRHVLSLSVTGGVVVGDGGGKVASGSIRTFGFATKARIDARAATTAG